MSALEAALALGVNLACSRPISAWSIVRAKGTFSATASHTSVRWLARDRGQGLWVWGHVPWQVKAPWGPPGSPWSRGWSLEAGREVGEPPRLHSQRPSPAPHLCPRSSWETTALSVSLTEGPALLLGDPGIPTGPTV